MMEKLLTYNPILLALLGTIFTWFMTAAGSFMVIFFKQINQKLLNAMLGFAAGIMIAAAFWSLLAPAIDMAEKNGQNPWLVAVIGFLLGGASLLGIDKILPHLHMGLPTEKAEGIKTSWERSVLLVLSITLHNIPEGLAVGVAEHSLVEHFAAAYLGVGCYQATVQRAPVVQNVGVVGLGQSRL